MAVETHLFCVPSTTYALIEILVHAGDMLKEYMLALLCCQGIVDTNQYILIDYSYMVTKHLCWETTMGVTPPLCSVHKDCTCCRIFGCYIMHNQHKLI